MENQQKPDKKVMQVVLSDDAIDALIKNFNEMKKEPHKVIRMGKEGSNQMVFMHQKFPEAQAKRAAEKKAAEQKK